MLEGTGMTKNILFLLPPGFEDQGRREYCPECAEVWGLLAYYPALRETLEVRYQPIERPRAEMAALFGEENQNCPTLWLLADGTGAPIKGLKTANEKLILDNARDIGSYFAQSFGTAFPRGS